MLSELLQRNIQGDSRKGSEYFEPQKKVDSVLKKEKQEKSNSKVEEIHTENV